MHCADDTVKSPSPLITPVSHQSWKTLLDAAATRQHATLMDVAKGLKEGDIPGIQYHRECRSIFTLKKSLDAIKEKQADSCTSETVRKHYTTYQFMPSWHKLICCIMYEASFSLEVRIFLYFRTLFLFVSCTNFIKM